MGVPEDQIAAWLAAMDRADGRLVDPDELDGQQADPGPLCIWPENEPVLALWMRLQTQWHRTPGGYLDGLRREAADITLRRARLADEDQVWDQLLDMEHAAVMEDASAAADAAASRRS